MQIRKCMQMAFRSGTLTWMLRVANSTPMVDFDSRQNSLRVNRDSRLDLPTPLSPIRTTSAGVKAQSCNQGWADCLMANAQSSCGTTGQHCSGTCMQHYVRARQVKDSLNR